MALRASRSAHPGNATPAAPMLTALAIRPDAGLIARGPHVDLAMAQLSAEARRHLTALYTELFATLHPAVAASYLRRLEGALGAGRMRTTWAGGALADPGAQHFTSIAMGPFLVEMLQTPARLGRQPACALEQPPAHVPHTGLGPVARTGSRADARPAPRPAAK